MTDMKRLTAIAIATCIAAVALEAHGAAPDGPAAPLAPAAPMLLTTGTQMMVPASAEVTHPNDQVVIHFTDEETDKDKAAAASRVNQKMKQGADVIRSQDPQAKLQTRGYYTHAIYPEEAPTPAGQSSRQQKPRPPIGWRVGQTLQVTTTSLATLPKMVAAAQGALSLEGLRFGLSPATTRRLDGQRIAATYADLNERVNAIATAMGRRADEAVLDIIDFDGSGNYARNDTLPEGAMGAPLAKRADDQFVSLPSFEPGETTLRMRVVGKVRFK